MEPVSVNSFALSVNFFPVWKLNIWKFLSELLIGGCFHLTVVCHTGYLKHFFRKGILMHFDFAVCTLQDKHYCCHQKVTTVHKIMNFLGSDSH
jgi:hypothetical protein